jgi:hypothetical protein
VDFDWIVPNTFAGSLDSAFDQSAYNLLQISDSFIAQNATAGIGNWPNDGNDILYPSATMTTTAAANAVNVLPFRLPAGFAALPAQTDIIVGAGVISLDSRTSIPKGTTVTAVGAPAAGALNVTLSANVQSVQQGERINFITGHYQRLVRRWRWYLQRDLTTTNSATIQNAISLALDDSDFQSVTFQVIEGTTQTVYVITEQLLDANFEFANKFIQHIILVTQATTAPDPID